MEERCYISFHEVASRMLVNAYGITKSITNTSSQHFRHSSSYGKIYLSLEKKWISPTKMVAHKVMAKQLIFGWHEVYKSQK